MTMTLPRRRFFVTAGLGAAGALALPLSPMGAAPRAPSREDAVLHHAGRELARLYKTMKGRPLYAEHYETLAANLRLMAMVFPDIRTEARKPRRAHDHGAYARRVEEVRKHLGIDLSQEPEPAPLPADEDARVRAQLAKEGLGPTLLLMAAAAEAKAAQVAQYGQAPPFRNAQFGQWCNLQPAVEVAAMLVCSSYVTSWGGAQAVTACYVAQVVVTIWRWVC